MTHSWKRFHENPRQVVFEFLYGPGDASKATKEQNSAIDEELDSGEWELAEAMDRDSQRFGD